jgi:tRNA(fMet)-specific endonuclease VapC
MLVLDTNHITALGYSGPLSDRLRQRLAEANQDTATTIITVEEQLRGWLSEIRKLTDPHDQIFAYSELQNRVTLFAAWIVLPWDVDSANTFVRLRKLLPRSRRRATHTQLVGLSPSVRPAR